MQPGCVKGEAQRSPLFWRFSGGLWCSRVRLLCRKSNRRPFKLNTSPIITSWEKKLQGLKSWAWLPKFCRTCGVLRESSSAGFLLCRKVLQNPPAGPPKVCRILGWKHFSRSWFLGSGFGQQLLNFRSPAVHWMARTSSLNCLSCRNLYQTPHSLNPSPLFTENPFFHWKVLRRIPCPKIGSDLGVPSMVKTGFVKTGVKIGSNWADCPSEHQNSKGWSLELRFWRPSKEVPKPRPGKVPKKCFGKCRSETGCRGKCPKKVLQAPVLLY